jgi:hypothetical protein
MNAVQVRRFGVGLALASLCFGGLLGCGVDPAAEPLPATSVPHAVALVQLTISQGTKMHVTLSTPVGSEKSLVGDVLAARTTSVIEVGGRVAIPTGSIIRGRVTEVIPVTQGMNHSEKGGSVVLVFDKVTTPGGETERLAASLTGLASPTGKTAGIIGGSAAGGIGTVIVAGSKGKELNLPAGSDLILTIDRPLKTADRT